MRPRSGSASLPSVWLRLLSCSSVGLLEILDQVRSLVRRYGYAVGRHCFDRPWAVLPMRTSERCGVQEVAQGRHLLDWLRQLARSADRRERKTVRGNQPGHIGFPALKFDFVYFHGHLSNETLLASNQFIPCHPGRVT